jgi:hypothetical protein
MSEQKKNENKIPIETPTVSQEALSQLLSTFNRELSPEQKQLLELISKRELVSLQRELITLEREQEDKQKRDEEKHNREAFRKSRLEAIEQERQAREWNQSQCNHRKENGRPSIGGQRDHSGHYMFICLNCMKQWVDGELPMTHRIPMELVGGPN